MGTTTLQVLPIRDLVIMGRFSCQGNSHTSSWEQGALGCPDGRIDGWGPPFAHRAGRIAFAGNVAAVPSAVVLWAGKRVFAYFFAAFAAPSSGTPKDRHSPRSMGR